ncbi:MAG: SDR family oxidoreductase [Pseudomonadota bacterium]
MSEQIDLSGKVVLITGGGKGVGKGISLRFLAAGASVIVCGRTEPEQLPRVGENIAHFTTCDVTDREQIDQCIESVTARFKRLDVLVNNAGGTPFKDAATASPRYSEKIIALNLIAPMRFSEAANTVMQTQDNGGCVVHINSVSALRPSPGTAVYGAAKAALLALAGSQARQWAPKVRVNSVVVGLVKTEQAHLHYGDEAGIAAVANTIPLQRLAEPIDIGNTCVYLSCELSGGVTGARLTVHGGGERPAFLDAASGSG